MLHVDNFIITTDFRYSIISFDYGLDLKLILSELTQMNEDERYIVANIYDRNYFVRKQRFIINDLTLYKFYFEKFRIVNLTSTKNLRLNFSKKAENILYVIGFFLLLGYQEDKEILQVVNKNNLEFPYNSFRYNIKLLMHKLGAMNRSQLRKILMQSELNSKIPACLFTGIAHERHLEKFLIS